MARITLQTRPMLAVAGEPFDSDEWLFEVKWDGIRALVHHLHDGLHVVSRRGTPLTAHYPEFEALGALPVGTVIDGEIVVVDSEGRPDFEAALRRDRPATLVAFDLLADGGSDRTGEQLDDRRSRLREHLDQLESTAVQWSEGVVGSGRAMFQSTVDAGLEGVVAKRRNSRYLPGRRADSWRKIKRREFLQCVVLGYEPAGRDDLKSLVLGAPGPDGRLVYVGKVGSGFGEALRRELRAKLDATARRAQPLVDCPDLTPADSTPAATGLNAFVFVEPALFCTVRFLEWTGTRRLRAPVFEGLEAGSRERE